MRHLLTLCLICSTLGGFAQTDAKYRLDMDSIALFARQDSCYHQLPMKVFTAEQPATEAVMRKLYYGFATRDEYLGDMHPAQYEIRELLNASKQAEAAKLAINSFSSYPVSPRLIYYMTSIVPQALSDEVRNAMQALYTNLLKTIGLSGDGSQENPYQVIAISDEYDFMYKMLGVKNLKEQSLHITDDGRVLDRMEVKLRRNAPYTRTVVWFDTTLSSHAMAKQFENEKN